MVCCNTAFPHSDHFQRILAIYGLAFAVSVNVKSLPDASRLRRVQILQAITVRSPVSVTVFQWFFRVYPDFFDWAGPGWTLSQKVKKHHLSPPHTLSL